MGVFAKVTQKSKATSITESTIKTEEIKKIKKVQEQLDEVFHSWSLTVSQLIDEANRDILEAKGSGQFFFIKPKEKQVLINRIGFAYKQHQFILESHKEYDSRTELNIYTRFICYCENCSAREMDQHSISPVSALEQKAFTDIHGNYCTARDFFIRKISDAIQSWQMMGPDDS
ncbi:MAG: hypothetical protein H6618_04805 [Deltaproteobacteria bacterium]|nr:hypothetical protein [Deltaproteobacteria bacterium]